MVRKLSRLERRLHERVGDLLPGGEEVRAAIAVFTGPRPGTEGIGVIAGLLGVLFVHRRRTYFTVAITDRGVVHFRNSGTRRPAQVIGRYELDKLRPVMAKWGEIWIELDGHQYWVEGGSGGELGQMRRLLHQAS